ncbi:hypothetical protein SLEP1_g27680 [Rubroshorea leprosula]|uniref:Uncharacterized protein n=1 Tax=Rubroshorea leprosula TaxID=152421 RepID=A0AAV5JR51_9ROSI|nr:hypothetical protein SLEP1_g27680 [Rubroshorea leprosula]
MTGLGFAIVNLCFRFESLTPLQTHRQSVTPTLTITVGGLHPLFRCCFYLCSSSLRVSFTVVSSAPLSCPSSDSSVLHRLQFCTSSTEAESLVPHTSVTPSCTGCYWWYASLIPVALNLHLTGVCSVFCPFFF